MATHSSFALQIITSTQANTFTGQSSITDSSIKLGAGNWSAAILLKLKAATTGNASLVSVDMNDAIFFQTSNFSSMFEGCTALTTVVMPSAKHIISANFEKCFKGCTQITDINMSNFSVYQSLKNTFEGATSLRSVRLGGTMPTGTLTDNTFLNVLNCNLYLPSIGWSGIESKWSSVTIIKGQIITAIEATSFTTAANINDTYIKLMGSGWNQIAFDGLKKATRGNNTLVTADFADLIMIDNTEPINFYYMFEGCSALTTIDLSKIPSINNLDYTFANCSSLLNVKLSGVAPSFTNNCFNNTNSFCKVIVPTSWRNITTSWSNVKVVYGMGITADQALTFTQALDLTDNEITLLGGGWSNASITGLKAATKNNTTLRRVDMQEMISTQALNLSDIFNGCSSLHQVIMPKTASSASSFANAFKGCISLKDSIDLSVFSATGTLSSTFQDCKKLECVVLPNTPITSAVSFNSTFSGCESLINVKNLSSFSNLNGMMSCFSGCLKLSQLTLPTSSTTEVNLSSIFKGCSLLTTVDLSAFTQCSNLSNAFEDCTSLCNVTLPTISNSLPLNLNYTFSGCFNLQELDLSPFTNITSMTNSFADCMKVKTIKMTGNMPTTTSNTFSNSNNIDCTLYVPLTGWENIETAQSWGNVNIIKGGGVSVVYPSDLSCIELHSTNEIAKVYGVGGKKVKIYDGENVLVFEGIALGNHIDFPYSK